MKVACGILAVVLFVIAGASGLANWYMSVVMEAFEGPMRTLNNGMWLINVLAGAGGGFAVALALIIPSDPPAPTFGPGQHYPPVR